MEIVKIPSKILTKKIASIPVSDIKSGAIENLIDNMRKDMQAANGVGLAANQVAEDLAVFVIDKKLAQENGVPDVFLNPQITEYSRAQDEVEEGCLSIPGFYVPVRRAKKIIIKALDENGHKIKLKARGFLARVLQHETDHLNGLTIKDRQGKQIIENRSQKFKARSQRDLRDQN